jgi:hypothetical protein
MGEVIEMNMGNQKVFTIIENNWKAMEQYGYLYGCSHEIITEENIQALFDGKCLAIPVNDEYVTFIAMSEAEN